MIVEPLIQAAAGMLLEPKGFLKGVRELCSKHNILLICDEVATGFGRTGKMFACEHENVSPDIMCVAKGITGGYLPLAATLTTNKIFNAFLGELKDNKTFFHGHTYTGNPLACAAALASLEVIEEEDICNRSKRLGDILLKRLKEMETRHPIVGEARGIGCLLGLELVKDKATREPFVEGGSLVYQKAFRKGLAWVPSGHILRLSPPMVMEPEIGLKAMDIIEESIAEVEKQFGYA